MRKEKEWFEQLIADFVENSSENRFTPIEPIWDPPLVGFAAGDDPFFEFFKEDIGEFYLLPLEMFKGQYQDSDAEAKLSPLFTSKASGKYGYVSIWSERHTAFVAGLGTFGLCDGLRNAP
ncbi:MAG: hypothetical protein Q8S19_08990 [Bacillota bacterium]|nr:hypothetical protein [Bacillota bacterium]